LGYYRRYMVINNEDKCLGGHSPPYKMERRGFTLAEAMMAMVVLGIAAAGVLLPFTSGAQVRAEGIHRTLAANLASDLMEQIVSNDFDDLKDFSTEEDLSSTYANFSRGASCAWDETQDFFILVTVWVKYNGREIAVINRLISK